MTHSNEVLNDLMTATRDGKSFYELAANEVTDSELRNLFTRIAKVKSEVAHGLAEEVRAEGDTPVYDGNWNADIARNYLEVRALLGDKNYTYVAQLDSAEEDLLEEFDKALADPRTTVHAREVIAQYLPEIRSCHVIMEAKRNELRTTETPRRGMI
jgi:uncharacterized protein (TIGR02284 family)